MPRTRQSCNRWALSVAADETGKGIEIKGTKRIGLTTETTLNRGDFGFDPSAIGPIGDEALILIDCKGTQK